MSGCALRADPRQHDLNPTVSLMSPTVTAHRLENMTSAGPQAFLHTINGAAQTIPWQHAVWTPSYE